MPRHHLAPLAFAPLAFTLAATAFAAERLPLDEATLKQAATLRDEVLARNEAYTLVESLTTEVGARPGGSEADARAVAWAQAAFKSLKFDRVWIEPVTFPRWVRRHESGAVLAPFPHPLALTALGGSRGTGKRPLEAEIVEFTDFAALQAARAEDVRGRIVYIGNRMQRTPDGAGYGAANPARSEGAVAAAKLGAVGLLIRSLGTDDDRLPHTGQGIRRDKMLADPEAMATVAKTRSGLPIFETPIPAAALSNPDADLLQRLLERGKPVRVRLDLDVGFDGEYTSQNVIGEVTGSERPEEIVLIGAHLDSWDLGTGAIDDGAGVAITMAAAHALVRREIRPRRSIRVVAFANEEQGVYGGEAYARAHASELVKHVLVAESDLGADRIYQLDTRVGAGALGAIDQMMQVLAPLGIVRGGNAATGGADTGLMVQAGVGAIELRQDATRYFDLHHTANDTLDKIDPKQLNQNVAAYAVMIFLAAQAEVSFVPAAQVAPK